MDQDPDNEIAQGAADDDDRPDEPVLEPEPPDPMDDEA